MEFVFALQEHFVENFRVTDPLQAFLTSTEAQSTEAFQIARRLANTKVADLAILEYVNMRHIEPILEAFDDDGSGFVTIREVNEFSKAKPSDWRQVC